MKKKLLVTLITFLILLSCSDTESEISIRGKDALITSVDLMNADDLSVLQSSVIDTVNNTITIVAKKGTSAREKLRFSAVIPKGAISKPSMNELIYFAEPVNYSILSESRGTISDWTVIVITENEEAMILSVDDVKDVDDKSVLVSSEIDSKEFTVSIFVKERTDLKKLKLSTSISENATIDPLMSVFTDFSQPVEYAVTSEDGKTTNKWHIDVVVDVFEDYDSGFDYDLDMSEWTLDESKSDNFNEWNDSKWNKYLLKTSSSNYIFNSENVFIDNGKLRLMVDYDGENYTAGKFNSNFELGENTYLKIRAKTLNHRAMVNSFISLYNEPNEGNNPNSKITLMKTLLGATDGLPNSFMSSLGQTNIPNEAQFIDSKTTISDSELSEDYHIYALERRSNYLRFFFDGEVVWEFETSQYPELSNQLLSLVFEVGGEEDVEPNNSRLPNYLLLDYVEVYDAVNTELVSPTYGNNLIENPSFEQRLSDGALPGDKPPHWIMGGGPKWVFASNGHGSDGVKVDGEFRLLLGHESSNNPFDFSVTQNINNLADGLYQLEVWAYIVDFCDNFDPNPRLFVRGVGVEEKSAIIDNVAPLNYQAGVGQIAYKKITINNIYVSNGSCEIGVHVTKPTNGLPAAMFVDDFSFYKVDYE